MHSYPTGLLKPILQFLNPRLDRSQLDFVKASNYAAHTLLCELELRFGINGNFLNLLKKYLTHRTQYVVVDETKSAWSDISSGVSQGTALGPYLFTLYIDALHIL
ncbi:hypothetical protein J437_LFUL009157 [Ladona fulva]|uniref:Reverse transcriptase n=1 Tax=Ladona fulva TaxID=123851 RepID=A0A8K0KGV0_LADFU|nr:hypothetical protein J437_LFUL009157 [Ladona fulva]